MSALNDSIALIEKINQESPPEETRTAILQYLLCSGDLVYTNPETIEKTQKALANVITLWAHRFSPIYKDKNIVEKSDLIDKDQWYVPGEESSSVETSGSTGSPFLYEI